MNNLKDLILYVFLNYPNPLELSKPRLVKILYLADWRAAFTEGRQLSNIQWFFNHYGPYVEDVIEVIKSEPQIFRVESYPITYGVSSDRVTINENAKIEYSLNPEDKAILDFVIERTYALTWDDFISLVYSTYPIKNSSKYSHLDLVSFGSIYSRLLATNQ